MHFTELVDLASERLGGAVLDASDEHDWRIIRLGLPGIVRGVVVDTAHFQGATPESCSIEAHNGGGLTEWTEILPQTALKADCENQFSIDAQQPASHLR